jgi:CBS domain containing-hemolysin-like protein
LTELLIFVVALVTLSGFMSLFEVSVFSCSPVKLSVLSEKHPHLGLFITKSKEIPSAIMVTNMVVDIGGSSIGGTMAYKLFGDSIAYGMYTFGLIFSLLIFSTLIPKLYAANHAATVLRVFGRVIIGIYHVTRPVVSVLYFFIKPFVKGSPPEGITQSEINSMIALAETNNLITDKQSKLINNILNISNKCVSDVFRDNAKIETVDVGNSVFDYADTIIKTGSHKRYVVTHNYGEKPYPVGIVLYRDLIKAFIDDSGKSTRIIDIMHPASITFDDDSAIALMDKLDKNTDHITVVVSRDKQEMLGVIQSDDIIRNLLK